MSRYFEPYEQPHFSKEEELELAVVESHLVSLVEHFGVGLEETEPTQVRGRKTWEMETPLVYKGEKVYLHFRAYLDEGDAIFHYQVCGGISAKSDSEFLEIKSVSTDNLQDALEGFQRYLGYAQNNHIPPEFLPEQNVWKEIDCGRVPKMFAGQVPLWQVIKEYELRSGKEKIDVRRCFTGTDESLEILYEGSTAKERVNIQDGKMLHAQATLNWKDYLIPFNTFLETLLDGKSREEAVHRQPPAESTYYNIKKFEKKFRELPWQSDFETIYSGSGILE